ncbi:spermatogenesis-associated protein 2-like [Eublepharis macularius]|uniref:Spermatogenesis-associated protein 2-like n=1 Tax=Eublepharis macularius TaxID=481883 RepID=A0AA97LIA0_EUBMA|nr:spermatogenesis-associated protein 2-like [Eublepharis macularius]
MRRPPSVALRVVFLDYLAFYRTNWSEGKLCVCNEVAVKAAARRFLDRASCPEEGFSQFNVYSIAEKCLQAKGEQGGLVFPKLVRAFEFLELLCVNLFLSPWRKEIRSLKTFTGNFVYCMQSVLPKCIVEELLEKIGYVATAATEFSLVRKLNEEEAEQAAFEIFLARIECEDLLEITRDVRDSDLRDVLQKRAQTHWHPEGEADGTHQPSQRKEYMLNRGGNNTAGYSCPQQMYLANSQLAFEKVGNTELGGELSLSVITAESQPVSSEFNSSNQSQASASTTSCVKSSDSEDFLTKYSDIVIGQKPLHLTNLPLKASEDKNRPMGLIGPTLGPPAKALHSHTLLSPNASGPQALAILNDGALEVSCDHGTQESSQETIESEIRDAMNCLSVGESHPIDQPKELKGKSAIQHGNKLHIVMSLSREEDSYASDQLKVKQDGEEALMYPIEETTQEESTMYNEPQEFSPTRVKLTDSPGGHKDDFSVDLYSSDQFRNTIENAYPTGASKFNRLLVGISSPHQAHECYGHMGEPASSPCTILPTSTEMQYPGGIPDLQGGGDLEGRPLQSSLSDEVAFQTCIVKMNETSPDDYVLISKD